MTAIDTQVSEVEKMFAVNVFGPMRMVHIFHPLLIQAKGTVVNIGSVGGIVPYVYGCKSRPILNTQATFIEKMIG
jgi:1-acylglycerone phosphate reductase